MLTVGHEPKAHCVRLPETIVVEFLLEPLRYEFMVRALIAACVVGVVCAVLGTYVVLRGMAFLGDALAHTVLPGVVIAFLVGAPLALGALICAVITAIAIGVITEQRVIKEDTAIGVVFAALFASGIALLSYAGNYTVDLSHFLFGNLLGVSSTDLIWMLVLATLVLVCVFALYKELLLITFDPVLAQTLRLPVRALNYTLLILIAITVVTALQVVGIALMLAVLVTPAATASLIARRVPTIMALGALFGVISAVGGLYASYYLDIASGAAVVLAASTLFAVTFVWTRLRGGVRHA